MSTMIKAFGAARMAVGVVSWLSPRLSSRIFGLGPDSSQPIVAQLFGARDFAMGYLTATTTGAERTQVLRVCAAIDAVDAVASLRQARAGTIGPHGMVLVGAGAAGFALIGLAALRAQEAGE
jgi:hypothetical protein